MQNLKPPLKLVLMASGSGTNAQNLMELANERDDLKILAVISDRADAQVRERAERFKTPYFLFERKNRLDHETLIANKLKELSPDLICLCGYMRLLSADFLALFPWKVINIHPSLLPEYPGLESYERAWRDGKEISGATVHFVDSGMDTGPIIAQRSFFRDPCDDFESFRVRGLQNEYALYRQVILDFLNDKIDLPT